MSTATADRIAALRAEGEAAVAAASSTADLEEVRVRFLGRKAELPNLLRDVGTCRQVVGGNVFAGTDIGGIQQMRVFGQVSAQFAQVFQ